MERGYKRIVLQHLRAEGYTEAAHCLERESGVYLDAEHVADLARRGAWDEAERYVGAFAGGVGEDPFSARILDALRRQKDIEALDRRITSEEGELLLNDLKAVAPYDAEVAKMVAALDNFRQHERSDTASARDAVALEMKKLIEANPLFQDKLEFPSCEESRLLALVNQREPEHQKAEEITKSAQKSKEITKPAEIAPPAACPRCTAAQCCCLTLATPSLPHGLLAKETSSLVQPPNRANLPMHPTMPTGAPSIDYPTKRICLGQPDKQGAINARNLDLKAKDESEKITIWKSSGGFLQLKHLPDEAATYKKIVGLSYSNDGMSLLALGSNGIFKFWKWQPSDTDGNRKLWHPSNVMVMKNDTSHGNPEEATACIARPSNDFYVVSASGGKVSLFDLAKFQTSTLMVPPPAATFITFQAGNNNVIALGMEDSTIQIYNVYYRQVKKKLEGHRTKITGLSFYAIRNVLVSSSADTQLCLWSTCDWKKQHSTFLIQHPNHSGALDGDTRVQFDDGGFLLVFNESLLAIYDWQLKCLCMWSPGKELQPRISSAVISNNGLLVYAGFCDGTVKIYRDDGIRNGNVTFCEGKNFKLVRNIQPSDYVKRPLSSVGSIYPVVIAVDPRKYQMALGMSDGVVIVLGFAFPTWTISWKEYLRTMSSDIN